MCVLKNWNIHLVFLLHKRKCPFSLFKVVFKIDGMCKCMWRINESFASMYGSFVINHKHFLTSPFCKEFENFESLNKKIQQFLCEISSSYSPLKQSHGAWKGYQGRNIVFLGIISVTHEWFQTWNFCHNIVPQGCMLHDMVCTIE